MLEKRNLVGSSKGETEREGERLVRRKMRLFLFSEQMKEQEL